MGLFGSKVERTLQKIKKKEMGLDVRYLDGNQVHPASVVRVDSDKFLMTGFAETLREDLLTVDVKALALSFTTKVTHKTHDIRGQLLYYCTLPGDFEPLRKHVDRYFVYPKAVAAFTDSSLEKLLVEHETLKTNKMYVWDITDTGLDLVNAKGMACEVGHVFEVCKILVGNVEAMVSLKVMGHAEKEYGKQRFNLIKCSFASAVEHKDALIDVCRRIDSM